MERIAIIPARGGSKRLPRKNLLEFCGEALVGRTIRQALESRVFGRVVVSTDDHEIAQAAREFGAEVPFLRPAELATDTASTSDAILDALDRLASEEKYVPEVVVCLQTTSPLRTAGDICAAAAVHDEQPGGEVASVCLFELAKPIWVIDGGVLEEVCLPPLVSPAYRLNGAIYMINHTLLRRQKAFLNSGVRPYLMPPERSVDIDTQLDFAFAEHLASQRE